VNSFWTTVRAAVLVSHAALVSVLSPPHDHWRYAYDPLNSLIGPSDWHRSFMQLEQRLRDWASRTGCSAGAHRRDAVVDYPDDETEWTSRVHDARKTCATLLVDLDVHPRVIMRILRHADVAVTMEIYATASSASTREALRRLGEALT
jgi:hypothetical protein